MNVCDRFVELAGVLATLDKAKRARACYDSARLLKRRLRSTLLPRDFVIVGFKPDGDGESHICIVPVVRTLGSIARASYMQATSKEDRDPNVASVDLAASFMRAKRAGTAHCIMCGLRKKAEARRRIARLH